MLLVFVIRFKIVLSFLKKNGKHKLFSGVISALLPALVRMPEALIFLVIRVYASLRWHSIAIVNH